MYNQSNKWHLITIIDPEGLPGKNIFNIIQVILQFVDFEFIIINDIEGAGKNWLISDLQKKENRVMELNKFLPLLHDVSQFDWGDFFLFKNFPGNWANANKKNYPNLIGLTDTTVRAIDDTYIYVYTPFDEIVEIVKKNYEIDTFKTDILENLEHPY